MIIGMRSNAIVLAFVCVFAGCGSEPVRVPSGADTFATHCASCHGPRAEGDGPVAATLSVNVPNLRTLSQRNKGQFPTDAVASYIDGRNFPAAHGTRNMPVWGPVFDTTGRLIAGGESSAQRIQSVIDYLRTLQVTAN
jgi:mono/diheme cytochrome c family protein